jgi:uncharacterized 2Fe-2S/4Fe-4S cluster protein (DUF4445 family)
VKIAASFGTHADRTKALTMGLFSDCESGKIECVGNAASNGCRAVFLSVKNAGRLIAAHVMLNTPN